jgi:hypothetical protein
MILTHRTSKLFFAFLATAALLLGSAAHGYNVGFNSIAGADGSAFTSHSEGGFSVSAVSGTWKVGLSSGNPAPSIYGEPPTLGVARVTDTTTGLFTFSSVDLAGFGSTTSTYTIEGFRNNGSVYSTGGTLNILNAWFTIPSPNPGIILDRLDISISGNSSQTFNVDNIVVNNAVPEPGTVALVAMTALAGCAICRVRRDAV